MSRTPAIRHAPAAVWLAAIVAVGLGVRLAWALSIETLPLGDSGWYVNVATNLAEGNGFAANHHNPFLEPPDQPLPTAYYPPLYPFLLAGVFKAAGVSVLSAQVLNAVLGALTTPLVYVLGLRLFDRRAGLLAAAVFALMPSAVAWLPFVLSEPLFTLIFTAALCALVAVRPTLAALLGFGLLTGLATLTRGEGLVLLPAAFVFWLARDGGREALRRAGLSLAVLAVMVTPWTVRNWLVLDSPVLVASSAGVNLRIGHNPEAKGTWLLLREPVDGVEAWRSLDRPEWETRAYRVYTQRALRYAFTHPWRELALAKDKVFHLYRSDGALLHAANESAVRTPPRALIDTLPPLVDSTWYGVLLLAVALAPLWLRRDPRRLLLVAVVAFWTLFHVGFFGLSRYHLPLLPVVVVAAAGGAAAAVAACSALLERWRARQAARTGPVRVAGRGRAAAGR